MTSVDVTRLRHIVENPSLIRKIRVENGLSQRTLANIVNCSQGTIWALEAGYRKQVSINIAKKLIPLANSVGRLSADERIQFLSSQIAKRGRFTLENAKVFASRGGQKGAVITAARRKRTSQEQLIADFLQKENVAFMSQALVWGKARRFIVDFALPSESSPKIIIEAKSLLNKFGKDLQMISLAWRIIKIRQTYPDTFVIVWLEGEIPKSALQIVKDEADYVALNEPVDRLLELVRNVTKHRSRI